MGKNIIACFRSNLTIPLSQETASNLSIHGAMIDSESMMEMDNPYQISTLVYSWTTDLLNVSMTADAKPEHFGDSRILKIFLAAMDIADDIPYMKAALGSYEAPSNPNIFASAAFVSRILISRHLEENNLEINFSDLIKLCRSSSGALKMLFYQDEEMIDFINQRSDEELNNLPADEKNPLHLCLQNNYILLMSYAQLAIGFNEDSETSQIIREFKTLLPTPRSNRQD
jgi:hypothetical protein